jgi:hypothetical protein
MNANDDTPCSGESVSDASVDYEKLAQALLSRELERHGHNLKEAFWSVSGSLDRGEGLDAEEWSELEEQVRQARFLVERVEEAME